MFHVKRKSYRHNRIFAPAKMGFCPSFSPTPSKRFWHYWPIRSAGANFALFYILIFVISTSLFLSFTWWNTNTMLNQHVQNAIENDAQDLIKKWNFGGPQILNDAINERLEQNIEDESLYLLIDSHGKRLSGNMPQWPPMVVKDNIFYEIPILRYQLSTRAQLCAYPLSGGYKLIVGHDIRGRSLLKDIITHTFIWCFLMIGIFALGGAFMMRQIFRYLVSSILHTTSMIAQGDLSHRITLNGSEIDVIAETINMMLERINRLMEGVKQVSNAIAHDLRTPIARARTQLEDASLHAQDEASLREAIEQAVGNLDHITSIFEALLRIAQIEAGTKRSAFSSVNLTHLLENMIEFYTALAEEKNITLSLHAPENLPTLFGDQHLLQQALANMLDNALKFSPSESLIRLNVSIISQNTPHASFIKISVCDQGSGMKEEDIEHAHERFFRADTARHTPGSGLGLSLVHAIAALHHGTLELENTHPGLKVSIKLPLTHETSSKPKEEKEKEDE